LLNKEGWITNKSLLVLVTFIYTFLLLARLTYKAKHWDEFQLQNSPNQGHIEVPGRGPDPFGLNLHAIWSDHTRNIPPSCDPDQMSISSAYQGDVHVNA
jgi:hypothetical protein